MDNAAVGEILKKLDADREAYLATLTKVHQTLAHILAQNHTLAEPAEAASVPRDQLPTSSSFPALPTLISSARTTRPRPSSVLELGSYKKGSIFTGEESSDSDDDESFFTQDPLPAEYFSEDDLIEHFKTYDWSKHGRLVLGDLADRRITPSPLFEKSSSNYADIYEIGCDGSALLTNRDDALDGVAAAWEGIRSVNHHGSRRKAVGKIMTLREPSPVLSAAAHLTMNKHFDMDNIFRLLTDDTPSKAYMKGCLKQDHRHHRSFVFTFKYHTIVGRQREPLAWQKADSDLRSTLDHIPISTCASVVALSLAGPPSQTLRRKSRRKKEILGQVHDAFAPWRVLSIQCYPDWQSTVDVHEKNRHYVNGPEAFLVTLLAEYRDASKRFLELNERIVKMVTPPNDFLFNKQLRDQLLFENNQYTYSRRYFWAFQALALLNDEIQAMISEYEETFTDDVWSGEHKYIWPGTAETSSRYSNFRKKLSHLRKQFEKEIKQLHNVLELNEREQKDIKSLRDQLFSGTSVLESREAVNQARISVMQGFNIRLLTLVSIFFLPLTFVTSVFGMTNMPPNDSFKPFGIVTATICVPTYFFLVCVNSPETAASAWKRAGWVLNLIASGFQRHAERMKRYEQKYRMGKYKSDEADKQPKRFASRTLSSTEQTQPTLIHPRRPSRADIRRGSLAEPPQLVRARTSEMVKFDLPDYETEPKRAGSGTLQKTLSEPGPRVDQKAGVYKGFLRTFSDRFTGNPSPTSSGILV